MDIDTRTNGPYQELVVAERTATLSSGLLDRAEAARLAYKLEQAAEQLSPEPGGNAVPEAVRSLLHRRNWSRVYIGVPRMKLELTLSEDEFERIQGMLASSGLRYGY